MIFVLTFLNFAFGTHSNGICLDSRHLVLGLRVQSTSVARVEQTEVKVSDNNKWKNKMSHLLALFPRKHLQATFLCFGMKIQRMIVSC